MIKKRVNRRGAYVGNNNRTIHYLLESISRFVRKVRGFCEKTKVIGDKAPWRR